MVNSSILLPIKYQKYLQQLADDHQVEINSVINELCEWAFSNPEIKKQFELWLDNAFPQKGEAEDRTRSSNQELSDIEENKERETEEEADEIKNYSEDRKYNHA
jgi:hypothetical protein